MKNDRLTKALDKFKESLEKLDAALNHQSKATDQMEQSLKEYFEEKKRTDKLKKDPVHWQEGGERGRRKRRKRNS